jgi:hypothetical protein
MGAQAENVVSSFTFDNEEDKDKYEPVLAKFDTYFAPKLNAIHERAMFSSRHQKDEPVETLICAIYEQSEKCSFGDNKDDGIRDQIVIGLKDKELSLELQLKDDLNKCPNNSPTSFSRR